MMRKTSLSLVLAASALAAALGSAARAAEPCPICATAVVTNADLAACFLAQYEALSMRKSAIVAVDLSDCEESRGVVEALPTVGVAPLEPDMQFVLSHPALSCLKAKLEEPGLALDPAVKIDLGACQP